MGRYRNVSILAAAVFIQLIGLAYQVKKQTGEDSQQSSRLIRVWTISAISPFEKGIVRLQTGTSNLWHNYIFLRGVRQENRELKNRIEQLQLEQVRLQQDATQARRLQALLGFKEQFIDQTVAAQVIGTSGSEQSRTVYLDKGSDQGIKVGMPVISADGIVGKVIFVEASVSHVLLINDQTSGVGTILERSRLQGVLKGKATGELALDKVMSEEDLKPGERVLTSGGDQIFPKGLPVGTIDNVKRGSEFLQVSVKPAASLNHLEEVLVITKKQEHEPVASGVNSMRAADILAQRLPSVPDKPAEAAAPGKQTKPAVGSVVAEPGTAATPPPGQTQVKPISPGAIGAARPQPIVPTRTSGGSPEATTTKVSSGTTSAAPVGKPASAPASTSPQASPTKPATTTQAPPPQTGDTPQ